MHFHKAAATSLVELAEANGEQLFLPHLNGNPTDKSGEYIDFDAFDPEGLHRFVSECLASGFTFIASEWSTLDLRTLAATPSVYLLTPILEPLARYV